VHTSGEPKGVKLQGGLHELITREVEIECLPDDIPEHLPWMRRNCRSARACVRARSDGRAMKLLSNPEAVISHVVSMKAEEVVAVDAAAVVAPVAAEPEIAKAKGKKEEEAAPADDKKKKSKRWTFSLSVWAILGRSTKIRRITWVTWWSTGLGLGITRSRNIRS